MGGTSKKILDIVEMHSKNRITLPATVRKILKTKKGSYLMFTRERDGVLIRRIDRFALDIDEEDRLIVDGANQEYKKTMTPQHTDILTLLKKKSMTAEDIAKRLDASEDSIRGRISELRNYFKFNIERDTITNRYTWKEWK